MILLNKANAIVKLA